MSQVKKARQSNGDEKSRPDVDRRQFAHLEGKPIRLSEAAIEYEIIPRNLSYWARRGHIRVLERGPKLVLLNEADVAYAAALAKANEGLHQGKRLFPRIAAP